MQTPYLSTVMGTAETPLLVLSFGFTILFCFVSWVLFFFGTGFLYVALEPVLELML